MQWWRDARFGMFSLGLVCRSAGEWNGKTGYGEWIGLLRIPSTFMIIGNNSTGKIQCQEWVKMAKMPG